MVSTLASAERGLVFRLFERRAVLFLFFKWEEKVLGTAVKLQNPNSAAIKLAVSLYSNEARIISLRPPF